MGCLMLGLGCWSLWLRYRKKLYDTPLMHRAAVLMGPAGFVAVLCGWIVTEVGRQPYTVYNLLTTLESHSPVDAAAIGASLIGFIVVYFTLFGAGTYYILRLMAQPPDRTDAHLPAHEPVRAAGVVSAHALQTSPPGVKP